MTVFRLVSKDSRFALPWRSGVLAAAALIVAGSVPAAAARGLRVVTARPTVERPGIKVAAGSDLSTLERDGVRLSTATPLVPSPFVVEVEDNDSSANATPLGGDAVIAAGNLFPNGDVDYWSFQALEGDRVYVATMTGFSASQSTESVLDVMDTDGATILETDDNDGVFGSSASSIAGVAIPTSGMYFVRVRRAIEGQLRPYRLFFQLRSGSPTPEGVSNDTPPGEPLPVGGWVSGSTSSTSDVDLYSVELDAGDTVFLSLDLDPERNGGEWNGLVGLGTFGGTYLSADDPATSGTISEAFFMTVKEAGSYSILVQVPAGGSAFGTYRLSATVFAGVDEGESCTVYSSTDVPKAIPEGPGSVTSTLTVPGSPTIADLDVAISLDHSNISDLDLLLGSPAGNLDGLFTDLLTAETSMDLVLDDEAGVPVDAFDVFTGTVVTPENSYRLSWMDGENGGGTWTLEIRDDLALNGGTLNGWSVRICEPPALPACPEGTERVVRYASDFEADAGGFTHSGTNDDWDRGLPSYAPITTCASGSHCWATALNAPYSNTSDQVLLSPAIDLTDLVAPIVVSWAHRYQLEDARFDQYEVDLRWSGGGGDTRLFEWLDYDQADSFGFPVSVVAESAGWGNAVVRADEFAGSTVEVRFHLKSDGSETYAGVAIDDVELSGCRSTSYIFADGFESNGLTAWSSHVP